MELSMTKVKTLEYCPLQFHWRYNKKLTTRPRFWLTFGSTIHKVLEVYYTHKKAGDLLVAHDLEEVFRTTWPEMIKKDDTLFQEEEDQEKIMENGIALITKYLTVFNLVPFLIEHKFKIKVPGVKEEVNGVIDLVTVDHDVRDHKVKAKAFNVKDLNDDIQLGCYSLAVPEARALWFDVLLRGTNQVCSQQIPSIRMAEEKAKQKLQWASGVLQKGDFLATTSVAKCLGCDYSEICNKKGN